MQSKLPLLPSGPGGVRKSAFHGPWQNRAHNLDPRVWSQQELSGRKIGLDFAPDLDSNNAIRQQDGSRTPLNFAQPIRPWKLKSSALAGRVTDSTSQVFREKELPELRDLATGKTTKAQYSKDSGVNELEENSGIKLLLAIKGVGLFTIGAMIIALGAAYKIAASNA